MRMTALPFSLTAIEHAVRDLSEALDTTNRASACWPRHSEGDLWRELVSCILGSRVRFQAAHAAVARMGDMGLLSTPDRSAQFDRYELDTVTALSGGYPFRRSRAKQIRRAAEHLYGSGGSIRGFLDRAIDVREARRLLAFEVSGLGPKQASLFLRNIGYATDVAVLDVHVLTYMSWVGLTDTPLKSISTLGRYEKLEDSFIEHTWSLGYRPDQFDLAVWVVVKVAKEESKTWES